MPDPRASPPDLIAAYVEHAPFVERVLRRAGVAERDVPDARQDVFVVAHRRLDTFEGRGRLSTWLYRIAWNVASEYRRRACHRREQLGALGCELDAAQLALQVAEADDSQALRLEHRELLTHALHALDALDDDKREAFVLSEVVGLSMREVAARAGVPLKTAFSRAYAARRRVLAALRERGMVLGLAPAWLPLRFRRLAASDVPGHAPSGSRLLTAQAQLALVALVCAPLPGLVGVSGEPAVRVGACAVAVERSRVGVRREPTRAVDSPAPFEPAAMRSAKPRSALRLRTANATLREAAASAQPSALPSSEPAPELVVVRDGHAWLVPAVDHPLDRAPAVHPALPSIVHLRGPWRGLGRMPEMLPGVPD